MPSYVPSTLYIRHLLYKTGAMHNAGGELLLMGQRVEKRTYQASTKSASSLA
jgi:hypothetical protein